MTLLNKKEMELNSGQCINKILEENKNNHYMVIDECSDEISLCPSDLNYIYSKGWKLVSHALVIVSQWGLRDAKYYTFVFEKI